MRRAAGTIRDRIFGPRSPLDELERQYEPRWRTWMRTKAAQLVFGVVTSTVVWLAALPLVALRFHIVSPIGILLNIPLIPITSTALLLGGLGLGLSAAWGPLGVPASRAAGVLLDITQRVVLWGVAQPWGYRFVAGPSWGWVAGLLRLARPGSHHGDRDFASREGSIGSPAGRQAAPAGRAASPGRRMVVAGGLVAGRLDARGHPDPTTDARGRRPGRRARAGGRHPDARRSVLALRLRADGRSVRRAADHRAGPLVARDHADRRGHPQPRRSGPFQRPVRPARPVRRRDGPHPARIRRAGQPRGRPADRRGPLARHPGPDDRGARVVGGRRRSTRGPAPAGRLVSRGPRQRAQPRPRRRPRRPAPAPDRRPRAARAHRADVAPAPRPAAGRHAGPASRRPIRQPGLALRVGQARRRRGQPASPAQGYVRRPDVPRSNARPPLEDLARRGDPTAVDGPRHRRERIPGPGRSPGREADGPGWIGMGCEPALAARHGRPRILDAQRSTGDRPGRVRDRGDALGDHGDRRVRSLDAGRAAARRSASKPPWRR